MNRRSLILLLSLLGACAGSPASRRAEDRRAGMVAAVREGEHARATELYRRWHRERRSYDEVAIRRLAFAVIERELASADPQVRRRAVGVAARAAGRELAVALVQRLDDPDASVRAAAADRLAGEHPKALRVARALLASKDPAARAAALSALAGEGGARAAIEAALTDPAAEVRVAAVAALGEDGRDADSARLLAIARTDADGGVRAEAFAALAMGKRGGQLEAGRAALADDYLGARLQAVPLLAAAGEPGRAELVAIARGMDAYLALRAAVTLRRLGTDVGTDALERALGDRSWMVRSAALNAVAQIAAAGRARSLLGEALGDARTEVRLAAARALVRLGMPGRAGQTFAEALADPDEHLRVQAALGLARMGDRAGEQALVQLLSSPRASTRSAAARAYPQVTDRAQLPLVDLLADPDPYVRLDVAEILLDLSRRRGPG